MPAGRHRELRPGPRRNLRVRGEAGPGPRRVHRGVPRRRRAFRASARGGGRDRVLCARGAAVLRSRDAVGTPDGALRPHRLRPLRPRPPDRGRESMSASADGDAGTRSAAEPVDRRRLVARHDVHRTEADPLEPLSVGNGELAFTVDVTGLQSLADFHESGMPLHTQAQWAWHSAPNPEGFTLEDAYEDYRDASGRTVPYLTTGVPEGDGRHERAAAWLRQNPHRIDLGRIGFTRSGGRPLFPEEIGRIRQRLDLWQGRVNSNFTVDDRRV